MDPQQMFLFVVFSSEVFRDFSDECYNVINREYIGMFISPFKSCG